MPIANQLGDLSQLAFCKALSIENVVQLIEARNEAFNKTANENNLWEYFYDREYAAFKPIAKATMVVQQQPDFWKRNLLGQYYYTQARKYYFDFKEIPVLQGFKEKFSEYLNKAARYQHFFALQANILVLAQEIIKYLNKNNYLETITEAIELCNSLKDSYGSIGYFYLGNIYNLLAEHPNTQQKRKDYYRLKRLECFRNAKKSMQFSSLLPYSLEAIPQEFNIKDIVEKLLVQSPTEHPMMTLQNYLDDLNNLIERTLKDKQLFQQVISNVQFELNIEEFSFSDETSEQVMEENEEVTEEEIEEESEYFSSEDSSREDSFTEENKLINKARLLELIKRKAEEIMEQISMGAQSGFYTGKDAASLAADLRLLNTEIYNIEFNANKDSILIGKQEANEPELKKLKL